MGLLPLSLYTFNVCAALSRVNVQEAACPKGIPGCVFRVCEGLLLTDIFNLSLAQAVVPTSFKTTAIMVVLEHLSAMALNNFALLLAPTLKAL